MFAGLRKVDRYLLSEVAPPFLLGLAGYTFLLSLKSLFDLLDLVVRAGAPPSMLFRLLGLSLPWIVVLTIPISFLLGILAGLGRLSSESELTALRAAGMSHGRILVGLLPLGILVMAFDVFLMSVVLPASNRKLVELQTELRSSRSVGALLRPGVFESVGSRAVRVQEVDAATGRWRRILVAERADPRSDRVTFAREGQLRQDDASGQVWLDLRGAATYETDLASPERHQIQLNDTQSLFLEQKAKAGDSRISRRIPFRAMTPAELRLAAHRETSPARRREAAVEFQKKFSIPAAAIAFLFVGLPLGFSNKRGGRGSGFALSIGLVALYYVVLNSCENWAVAGRLPPFLAPWIPNLAFMVLGSWFLSRVGRDLPPLPEFRLPAWRRWRPSPGGGSGPAASGAGLGTSVAAEPARTAAPAASDEAAPGASPEAVEDASSRFLRSRGGLAGVAEPVVARGGTPLSSGFSFPTLLDRYLVRTLAGFLGLAVSSVLVLFIVVDYSGTHDEFLKNQIPPAVIAAYYRVFSLQILHDTVPFSFLIASLVTLGLFARRSEMTAAKASGVSLYRLAVPFLAVGALLAAIAWYYQDRIVPVTAPETARLRAKIRGKELSREAADRRWFAGGSDTIIGYRLADRRSGTLIGVSAFVLGPDGWLLRRFEAARAERRGSSWILEDGWERRYGGGVEILGSYSRFPGEVEAPFGESLEALTKVAGDDLSLADLSQKIRSLEAQGVDVRPLRFQYHFRWSAPFAAFVLGLLAIPFAARFGRRGTTAGIGIGLGLGMAFLTTVALFSKLGEAGQLPALLAAWSPYVIFGLGGTWLLLGTET